MFASIISKLTNPANVIAVLVIAIAAIAISNRVGFVRNLVGPAS